MARNFFAGGGVNAFMGDNNPLYVQNMNSLKAAFTDLQNDIAGAGSPIGSVIMWTGDPTAIPTTIPAGYAVANGASVPTATYAELFAIIGYRYGGAGANFNLPDLTTRIPQGTVGVPVVPTTKVTSVSSNVDAHTHTVNSALTGANSNWALSGANSNIGLNTGNVSTHTHSGGTISGANSTIGNTQAHSHVVTGNTGGQSSQHSHSYTKPNSGNNSNTGGYNTDHSHGILFNSQGANANGINGSNSNIGINAQGAPNVALTIALTGTNSNIGLTGANSNIGLTAGNATTISAPVLTHTHNFAVTELVFIIRVS